MRAPGDVVRGAALIPVYHRRVNIGAPHIAACVLWLRAAALAMLLAVSVRPALASQETASPEAESDSVAPLGLASASSGEHAWVALPAQRSVPFLSIYHLPPDLEPGSVRGGPRVGDVPVAMAAFGGRLVMVMREERVDTPASPRAEGQQQASSERSESARLIRRVLTLTTRAGPADGMWQYFPARRDPIAMPSLPGRGTLVGVTMTGGGMYALLSGIEDADALFELRENARGWTALSLPPEWRTGERAHVVTLNDTLVLAQRGVAWRLDADATEPADAWRAEAADVRETDVALVAAGGSLVAAALTPQNGMAVRLLRQGGSHDLSTIDRVVREYAVVTSGDTVVVVWRGDEDDARLQTTVLSAVTGALVYDGPARTNAVVTGREIQSLALIAGALMLTILIFVLRPEDAINAQILLPEGYALASPSRRVGAVLLDLAVPMTASALAFGVSGGDLLAAAVLSETATARASVAFGCAFLLTGVHSFLGEWLFGRTLGKFLLRCRTQTLGGEKPRVWQASLRTVVKLLFPPFALFLFLDPRRRHPGDLVSGTVVVQRARSVSAEDGSPPSRDA